MWQGTHSRSVLLFCVFIYYTFVFRVGSEALKLMVETHRLVDILNVRYLFEGLIISRQLFSKIFELIMCRFDSDSGFDRINMLAGHDSELKLLKTRVGESNFSVVYK